MTNCKYIDDYLSIISENDVSVCEEQKKLYKFVLHVFQTEKLVVDMEQAEKYGHSRTREYAFLIAHSMLHLFGYDHMVPEEARVMEAKQAAILESLNILR